jgi:hypothetical protein
VLPPEVLLGEVKAEVLKEKPFLVVVVVVESQLT